MTLAEALTLFRSERDDAVAPYLWSAAEFRTYLNSAIDEACERALLIEDSTTAECSAITLVVGEGSYPLHASIIKVKRVTFNGIKIPEVSVERLDETDSFWENRTGPPMAYVMTGKNTIRFVPSPAVADDIKAVGLTVYRTPLLPYDEDSDEDSQLELSTIYHYRLMPWIYRCALMKRDTQTLDEAEAARQEKLFERSFGERPDANVQRKRRDKRPPVTRMVW
jgi:hypothetical protein